MADKYLIFFAGVVIFVPAGILVARSNPRVLNFVFVALLFGTTQPGSLFGLPTDINFLSREWYRGTTRGIEISYLDLLAVILLFSSLSVRAREGIRYVRPPSFGFFKIYFIWALLTVLLVSEPKIFGLFELTKIFRAMVIFLAVWAFMRSPDQVRLFVYVLIMIAFYEAAIALHHRYILGAHRVSGTLGHPNALSMYCLQIFPILISVWFAHDISPRLRKFCLLAIFLTAGVIILTISRTGFASLVILAFFTILLNVRNRLTARNIRIIFLAILASSVMTYKAWDSLSSRFVYFEFENEYLTEKGDRGSYFRQGMPALEDDPLFGVGLNNWSYWISNRYGGEAGYYVDPYPSIDFAPPDNSRQAAPAHNLYLLTVVELGWVGLVLLVALFVRWLYISGTGLLKIDGGLLGRVRLGAFFSLCGVLMQSTTEWEFRITSMYFLGHITISIATFIYYTQRITDRNRTLGSN